MTGRVSGGRNYVRLPVEERVYAIRKPDHPEAKRFGSTWYLPLEVLADDAREMPETVPDDETLEHRARCHCHVCARPQATILWRQRHRKTRGPTS